MSGVPVPGEIAGALSTFGVAARRADEIAGGRFNRHWRVDAGDAAYVLRRYNAVRTAPSVAYEHALLAHVAAAAGWPVAVALPAPDGRTIVEEGGRLWSLFPFLPGDLGPAHNVRHLRIKGRLLARLHRAMASFAGGEQRAGFGRVWELDAAAGADEATFNDLLRAFGRDHPELAAAVRRERYRSLRELSRLAYGELPDTVMHGDFQRDNLLFDGGELTAVLDFDHAHRDARVTDIAWSIISDCAEPPAETAIHPGYAAAFVGGYAEDTPLTDAELRLIVPLIRAHNLAIVAGVLRALAREPSADLMRRLERRVLVRLPQLEQRCDAIERAVVAAARG